jgi:hypothetical protein
MFRFICWLNLILFFQVDLPRAAIKPTEVLYDFTERLDTMNRVHRVWRRWAYGHAKINGQPVIIEEVFFKVSNC